MMADVLAEYIAGLRDRFSTNTVAAYRADLSQFQGFVAGSRPATEGGDDWSNVDLPRILRKLDNFDFLLLDDLGYLPQGAEE